MENSTINLTQNVFNSINDLFSQMFSSIDNSIYKTLDDIVFVSPDILNDNNFQKILGTSSRDGILLISNSLIFGILLFYAINYLISHLTYSKIDSPKQFIFKAIIFIAIMNSSEFICSQIIYLVHSITSLLSSLGVSLFGTQINLSAFVNNINKSLYTSDSTFNVFSLDGIIKSFASFGLINLLFTYSLRYILIKVFILLSPFAFLSLITNKSEWFFNIWIRTFLSLLCIQIFIILILLLAFTIDINQSNNLSKILYIGIIYALQYSNSYMKEMFGGITTTINSNISNLKL